MTHEEYSNRRAAWIHEGAIRDWPVLDELLVEAAQPRQVTTVEELDALPALSVILVQQGATLEKLADGWYRACIPQSYVPRAIWLPATVLFAPVSEKTAEKGTDDE